MATPDHSLSETLKQWSVCAPAHPDFRTAVWDKIGDRSRQSWGHYLGTHAAAWTVVAAVAIGAAAYAGHATARARLRAERETLVVSYLVELDPRVQALLKP